MVHESRLLVLLFAVTDGKHLIGIENHNISIDNLFVCRSQHYYHTFRQSILLSSMLLQSGPLLPCSRPVHGIIVLIIDPQNDYHSNNTMAVPGALEDSFRISDMLYRERLRIDRIIVTLNSRNINHISHAAFWEASKHVRDIDNPHTVR